MSHLKALGIAAGLILITMIIGLALWLGPGGGANVLYWRWMR
jgi:hypothetical protein